MELRIDRHIQELLYLHNCVIIPSFGGFVANYKGAEIHPTQHIFTAPSKQLVFNKNLIMNDGLLANHIVQTEFVTYPEALEIIDKDVFKIKHLLSSGEKVALTAIGYLRLDVEKNIQFSPVQTVNYATSSYGLHSFQSPAIKRGGFAAEVGKTFKDRPAVKSASKFKRYKKYAVPLLILPVALALFFSPVSSVIKETVHTSGFFSKGSAPAYTPHEHQFNLQMASIVPMKLMESTEAEETALPVNETSTAVAESTQVAPVTIPETTIANETGNYTLVAGCFAILENAQKQIEQLKVKHINAAIVGKTKNGLYRVGCGSYNTIQEANEAMLSIRQQQTDVWVLKN